MRLITKISILRYYRRHSPMTKLIAAGYCQVPYRFGRLHCHCDKPDSLECKSRAACVKQAIENMVFTTILFGDLEVIELLDHVYVIAGSRRINNIVRLLFQFNVDFTFIEMQKRSAAICENVDIRQVLNIIKFFNVGRTVPVSENESSQMIACRVSLDTSPKPVERNCGWACWWLLEICGCKRPSSHCGCSIRFKETEVSADIIKMALNNKIHRPKMLISYIKHWFILTGNDLTTRESGSGYFFDGRN